jgi:multiple sugar transport system permease protein
MTKTSARRTKLIITYTLIILICVVTTLPFYWLLRSSLMDKKQLFKFPIQFFPNPIIWENYPEAMQAAPFGRYFVNTMILVVGNMAGTVITSALAGYSFSRLQWSGKKVMFYCLLSTMMLPGFITLIPLFLIWNQLGFVNTYVPLILPAWLGGGAYNIFLVRQFFMTIPKELDEAGVIEGASYWTIFWKILLPQVKPVLAVVAVFTFMNVWNDLLGPVIYLNDELKYTLSVGLSSFSSLYNTQWGYLMAASAVITLPMVLVFFFFQRYFIEGVTLTGIKG